MTQMVPWWRIGLAALVVWVVSQAAAVAVHGFLLAGDYRPFYGTLLRSDAGPAWQMAFLPVAHLSFTIGFVWLFRVARLDDARWVRRAVRIGVMAWLIGPAPMFLRWFAEQPWPGTLVVKQLSCEFAVTIGLALVTAMLMPRLRPTTS